MNQKLRDTLIVLVALAGIVREAALGGTERPYLYALYGSMLGLPYFFRRDGGPKDPPSPSAPAVADRRLGEWRGA